MKTRWRRAASSSGDFHEWFEIDDVPTETAVEVLGNPIVKAPLKTVESKLFFNGQAGNGRQRKLPDDAEQLPAPTTSYLELETYRADRKAERADHAAGRRRRLRQSALQTDGDRHARNLAATTRPDGVMTDVHVPQNEKSNEINTADIADAHVTLPEGLTLNPSAAHGLEACTQSQLAKGTAATGRLPGGLEDRHGRNRNRPAAAQRRRQRVPGQEERHGAITGPPYLIFIDAESNLRRLGAPRRPGRARTP